MAARISVQQALGRFVPDEVDLQDMSEQEDNVEEISDYTHEPLLFFM